MDFVIQSKSANQLISFMSLQTCQKTFSSISPKYFLVLENSLLFSLYGKSLLEYYLDVATSCKDLNPKLNFFERIAYLLQEIGQVDKFKAKSLVNFLLKRIESSENDLKVVDFLLGYMIAYWNPFTDFAQSFKKPLIQKSPFFELLFMILEQRSDEFIQEFSIKIHQFEMLSKVRYNLKEQKDKSITLKFISILVLAAIRTNQHKVINCILSNSSLAMSHFYFTENMEVTEIHKQIALILLKQNHQLGGTWLTGDILIEFFDSRIKQFNEELIEIDYGFMSNVKRQKIKITGKCDMTDVLWFQEDLRSLEFIEKNESSMNILSHPIIKTYIDIKRLKYHRIFKYNFFMFVIFFLIPILNLLAIKYKFEEKSRCLYCEYLTAYWMFGIFYIIIREVFQLLSSKSIFGYFKSNLLDLTLIGFSIDLALSYKPENYYASYEYISKVLVLVLSALVFTSDNPNIKYPLYLHIFKKVGLTFISIVSSFIMVLIAFSYSFYVIFDAETWESVFTNNDYIDYTYIIQVNSTTYKNFNDIETSFVKVLTMLSGSYSIEPCELDKFQLILFVIFFICSSILYNLILGLSIENISEVKHGSKSFILSIELGKIIGVATKLRRFHQVIM